MKKLLIVLVLFTSIAALGVAQNAAPAPAMPTPTTPGGLPDTVVNGFKSFLSSGYGAAMSAWTQNSPLGLQGSTIAALNNVFLQASNVGGNFVGAEVVRIVNFSPSSMEVYIMAKYQKSVLYMSFNCYKSASNPTWIINIINADPDPSKILPTNIMGGL